ncbi:uncharacterized protein METZ01_LOCUS70790 [marine metagenome]|uniref:Uncharacterized protein n=1 Tax=marine metagenome TaxID=408172 RepID=A0A381TPC7_9ZZZZ
MIFNLKRRQQRKHSWMVLRAINRLNGHDKRENGINRSYRSFLDQKETHFLTS